MVSSDGRARGGRGGDGGVPGASEGGTRRLLILGGGHAGVACAKVLQKALKPEDRLEVVLASNDNVEVWHGFIPQIIASRVMPQQALIPIRKVLPGATVYPYHVEEIDLAGRTAALSPGDERQRVVLDYDYLLVSVGAVSDLSRFPGLIEHGLPTKSLGDAINVRNHLIDMLERGAVEQDPVERRRLLTFVVAGAGWAGVEIASQVNDLVQESLRLYPTIAPSEIRFVLVSQSPRILPAIDEGLARRAMDRLVERGIEVKLANGLREATANAVTLADGEQIPTRSLIATVGIGTNPVVAGLPLDLVDGRIPCDQYCRVLGWPGVYAAGDCAAVPDLKKGGFYPPTAVFAYSQGETVAHNLLAAHRGTAPKPYFDERVELALLGKAFGVAQVKGRQITGLPAALLWYYIFLSYMPLWNRRIGMVTDWLVSSIFTRDIAQLRFSRSDAIVPMRFGAGETIVREGEPGGRFYIVTEGEVEVVRRGADGREERLNTLGPGQYFGEMALLQDTRRNATVRARVDTRVLSIARQDFSTLVQHLPMLRQAVTEESQARHTANEAPDRVRA